MELTNRLVCYDIKDLGKQLKKIGMLVVQDQVWGRVTENRIQGRSTRYYMDEMHLLLREDQTAAYTVEIWKRFREWGGIPTGITQNVKDLLASKEVENIFENSDFIYMLNQAVGDRQILAKQLNISPHQLSYVTHSGEGEGLLFYGNVILPFVDRFWNIRRGNHLIFIAVEERAGTSGNGIVKYFSFPDHMDRNDICRFIVAGAFQIADIFKHLVHSIFIQVPEWIKRTLANKLCIDIVYFKNFT